MSNDYNPAREEALEKLEEAKNETFFPPSDNKLLQLIAEQLIWIRFK